VGEVREVEAQNHLQHRRVTVGAVEEDVAVGRRLGLAAAHLGEAELGRVPRHRRVVPRHVRQRRAVGRDARVRVEVAAGREDRRRAGAVERHRDDLVDDVDGLGAALGPVVLAHGHERRAARRHHKVGEAVLAGRRALRLGRQADGLGVRVGLCVVEPLRLEVGVDHAAIGIERVRAAAVLVHARARVVCPLLGRDVHRAPLIALGPRQHRLGRGALLSSVAHDDLAARLDLAPWTALEPVQLALAVDAERAQAHSTRGDKVGGDRRRPASVWLVGLHRDRGAEVARSGSEGEDATRDRGRDAHTVHCGGADEHTATADTLRFCMVCKLACLRPTILHQLLRVQPTSRPL